MQPIITYVVALCPSIYVQVMETSVKNMLAFKF